MPSGDERTDANDQQMNQRVEDMQQHQEPSGFPATPPSQTSSPLNLPATSAGPSTTPPPVVPAAAAPDSAPSASSRYLTFNPNANAPPSNHMEMPRSSPSSPSSPTPTTAMAPPRTPTTPTTPRTPRTPRTPQTPRTPTTPSSRRRRPSTPGTPRSPASPFSPTSALSVSASAVSATEQPRFQFAEMSASIDATPMPRYLSRFPFDNTRNQGIAVSQSFGNGSGSEAPQDHQMAPVDDVEAELQRMNQRQLPRGDLGRREWRLDTSFNPPNAGLELPNLMSSSGPPSSVGSGGRDGRIGAPPSSPSMQSIHSINEDYRRHEPALPHPPSSPPSSPRSKSASESQFPRSPQSVSHLPQEDNDQQYAGAVVWGTNISVAESMSLFRQFVHEFRLDNDTNPMALGSSYYLQVLAQIHATEEWIFNLNCQHLLQFRASRKLYNQLILFPQVLIRILDLVAMEEFRKLYPEASEDQVSRIQVRPYHLSEIQPMRMLNPSDIDQLVCLKGMVTRCSSIIPDLKAAFFRCTICHATQEVELDRGRIEEPTFCERCGTRWSMEMIHNRCAFTDKQMVKMQETPDAIPEGETPYTVMLFAFDDLVDEVRPGDKVEVTGIYRAVPLRTNSRQRVVKSVFKTYVDVVHFRKVDELTRRRTRVEQGLQAQEEEGVGDEMDDEQAQQREALMDANRLASIQNSQIEEFRRIASNPNVYSNLAHSLAPSIWELDDVKKGILCQLFGGTRKSLANGISSAQREESSGSGSVGSAGADGVKKKTTRSDINILLCGDPGTSKSQLLGYVHKLTPRSIYTSGKGSSAVGLTASVIRDMETGDLVLESGALVLSDEGICCIDEFDKMSDSARSVLHEVMEQQTVSIAKAGIICSLNARASILASANPIESRYNPNKSVIENVNILPTLLSRFDLIYLILDKPHAETDRKLAKHIVSLYFDGQTRQRQPRGDAPELISMKVLSEYIAHAKRNVHPTLTLEAKDTLIESYLELRRMGGGSVHSAKKNITATPRQLESLIRLSEALARMKLCAQVTRQDVLEALRLMNVATQRAAMDPRTGTIDMDMINTGHSTLEREAIADLIEHIMTILAETSTQTMAIGEMRRALEEKKQQEVKGSSFQMALRSLEEEDLVQISHGTIRLFGSN